MAGWRQLKASWRSSWTPTRIVVAGLVSGYLVGRVEPARQVARGSGFLQMVSAASALLASGSASAAADGAKVAASTTTEVAQDVAPDTTAAAVARTEALARDPEAEAERIARAVQYAPREVSGL